MRLALLTLALVTGCGSISGQVSSRYGARAGAAADQALDQIVTAGPALGVESVLAAGEADFAPSLGIGATALAEAKPPVPPQTADRLPWVARSDLALTAALTGGYAVRGEHFLVRGHLGVGWWRLAAGLNLTGAFASRGSGFALGPEATFHLRLGADRQQQEIQVFIRGDFFVSGADVYSNQAGLGARFIYDLYQ